MDFEPTESQQAVADLATQVLAGPDPAKELAQVGLLDASELGIGDVAALLTEIGRRAAPDSLRVMAMLMTGALPVLRWGDAALQRELLPAIASGELTLTAALREPSDPAPPIPATTLTNGKITGTKIGVPFADHSRLILVPARLTPADSMIVASSGQIATETGHDHEVARTPAPAGLTPAPAGVVLVAPGAPGVRLTRTPSSSGQPEFTVHLDQAPIESVLGGAECAEDLYRLAVAGACALIDGAVAGALALTRDHVATREQFGRPLAAFQAVSQQIADVYIASRTLHLATVSACWQLARETGSDHADLDVAGYWCAEQATRSVRICHHLHGGLGMDVTYPLHRFSSLVADLVRFLGGAEYRLERLACFPN
jgi:3-oxo-4-pregnene-20-carboxyl-CoA dehydrogenase alpha subunit